jgi:nicotinamide-nucleotide amidase
MKRAEIVAIGTELTSGQKLDTNSQWLSRRLGSLGLDVRFHTTLGDDLDDNVAALRVAADRAEVVLVTGGLGPTQDDLTREALAAVSGVGLVEDTDSLAEIAALFARRNREMPDRNRVQALRPSTAQAMTNSCGTAPGLWLEVGGSVFIALPGVPREMKAMFEAEVVPRLRASGRAGSRVIAHRVINLFGRGESEIEAEALDLTARGHVPEVGITASDATISFRVSAEGASEAEAFASMEATVTTIRSRFGSLVLGEGEGFDVPQALAAALRTSRKTLALAESCTGGLAAARLTAEAGVSTVFRGGVVSYSNESKTALLGVPAELITRHGAVSAEVAEAMAAGVRERLAADMAVSVTGIAGPDGGSEDKPVGLVYLGLATADGVQSRRLELGPEQPRAVIQSRAAKNALNWARLALLGA